jgi:heme o synthase
MYNIIMLNISKRVILLKHLISLTKPGIIAGNLVAVVAGCCLALHAAPYAPYAPYAVFDYSVLIFTVIGICLVMASGCVFNNCIDRDIDALMARTCKRVMVTKLIHPCIALTYGTLLGITGLVLLYLQVNSLAALIALFGWVFYVVVYSLWFKRSSIYGTHIGSISGAIPPVVGYISVTGQLDLAAALLFAMLSLWQMPHSFAIAIFRLKDYQAANIAVLPVKLSMLVTKINMLAYVSAFVAVSLSFSLFGYTGVVYSSIAAILGIAWIYLACLGFVTQDNIIWARKMFIISIAVLMSLCLTIILSALI